MRYGVGHRCHCRRHDCAETDGRHARLACVPVRWFTPRCAAPFFSFGCPSSDPSCSVTASEHFSRSLATEFVRLALAGYLLPTNDISEVPPRTSFVCPSSSSPVDLSVQVVTQPSVSWRTTLPRSCDSRKESPPLPASSKSRARRRQAAGLHHLLISSVPQRRHFYDHRRVHLAPSVPPPPRPVLIPHVNWARMAVDSSE